MNQKATAVTKKKINPFQRIKNPFLKLQTTISESRSAYLAYCFVIPVVVMYLIYLAMEIHPFGNGSVLVLDLNGQYVYFFEALRDAIHGDGSLLYSFERALGGEFMGIYAYYIASPLSYIVALFPQHRMLEALLTILLLKTGFCGLTFGIYLHKNSNRPNKLAVVSFSLMYAMCAYAVVHQNNTMWIDALIWLPLLVYGLEQLIKHRKYKLYTVSLAMTLMSNYYIGYMVCIFAVAYFIYYSFANRREEINPNGERAYFLRSFARFGFFSVIAALISAFILCGAYYSLTFGKDTFSNPSWAFQANFNILDFFTKLLPGSYDTVRPEGLPFIYCGLLALLLVPVYFMSKKFTAREKVASILLIAFFILSFIIKPIDLIWHGFSRPNWLNYRYSFMLCFFLLVLAYKGMGNLRRVGEKFVLGVAAFIILFVAVCEKQEFESYVESSGKLLTLETVWLTVLVTTACLILLCLLIRFKHPKKRENIMAVLAAVVCIEIFCSGLTCVVQFDKDVLYSKYDGYNNFLSASRPIINRVLENDKGFYRMEKVFYRRSNDNMALNIRGLSNSTSTLNADTITFLNQLGYDSKSHVAQYIGGTPVSDALLGIKYLFSSVSSKKLVYLYDQIDSDESYVAYHNPYALSIAYGVDSSIADFRMNDYYTFFERQNALVGTMLGDKDSTELFKATEPEFEYKNVSESVTKSRYVFTATAANRGTVTYKVTAPRTGEFYFYAPGSYTSATGATNGAKLAINNNDADSYFGSSTNRVIYVGHFEEGDEITIKLTLRNVGDTLTLYRNYSCIWSLDQEVFEDTFKKLGQQPQYIIDEGCSDDRLTGSILTTKADQTIQTTIPYDKGWKIYVDGVEVETYETLNALIAFDISEAGQHTLEMKYWPDIYTAGTILSVGGLTIFLLLCLTELILKKTVWKNKTQKIQETYWVLEDFEAEDEAALLLPPPPQKKRTSWKNLFLKKKRALKEEAAEIKNSDDLTESVSTDSLEHGEASEQPNNHGGD